MLVASQEKGKNILILDLLADDPNRLPRVFPHGAVVKSKVFSLDGERLVTTADDGAVRVWDLKKDSLKLQSVLMPQMETFSSAVVIGGPDNTWVIVSSGDFTARLFDLEAADPQSSSIRLADGSFKHKDQVQQVAISPDDRWAVTSSLDSRVALWDLTANDPTATPIVLKDHDPEVTDALNYRLRLTVISLHRCLL